MSDDDALRAAVLADPESDLPRLVYADFIQESGNEAGAEFIRAQVELANTPEYEPFAVDLQSHRPELLTGEHRHATLPAVTGIDWMKFPGGSAFRRGFGWMVSAVFLPALVRGMPLLRAREPVQALSLPNATIPDQLDDLARAPWLPDIRKLWFSGLNIPTELVRMLCATPAAMGLRELDFTRGDSHATPVLLDGIFQSPLGRSITTLSLLHSTDQSGELVEPLMNAPALESLTLRRLSQAWQAIQVLGQSEVLGRLRTLSLTGCYLTAGHLGELLDAPRLAGLAILDLSEASLRESAAELLADCPHLVNLRKLNLSDNSLGSDGVQRLARSGPLGGLRSLLLRQTGTDNAAVRRLTRGPIWMNLVELDLTRNPIDDRGAAHLLTAPTPPDLTALRLSAVRFSEPMRQELAAKFGPAVRFVPEVV